MLLKKLIYSFNKPLEIIFNIYIESETFPKTINLAEVILIYKNKNKHILKKYRSISLLPFVSKLLEKSFIKDSPTTTHCSLINMGLG